VLYELSSNKSSDFTVYEDKVNSYLGESKSSPLYLFFISLILDSIGFEDDILFIYNMLAV